MILIDNVPFIDYQLKLLANNGITKIALCVGYLADQIRDYVGDGGQYGLHIDYIEDGDTLVGTGGALRRCYDANILDETFAVIYGDSFLPIDYQAIFDTFSKQSLPAMMVIFYNNNRHDVSNVILEDGLVIYDKSRSIRSIEDYFYIDYGLSVLRRDIIRDYVPSSQKWDLATVYSDLSVNKNLGGHIVDDRFYEIGSTQGLKDFTDYIASK